VAVLMALIDFGADVDAHSAAGARPLRMARACADGESSAGAGSVRERTMCRWNEAGFWTEVFVKTAPLCGDHAPVPSCP
jgi:hypothetical protein